MLLVTSKGSNMILLSKVFPALVKSTPHEVCLSYQVGASIPVPGVPPEYGGDFWPLVGLMTSYYSPEEGRADGEG